MPRPSLVIYLPTLASGGAERLHIILAPEFIAAGYDVTFLLHQHKGSYSSSVPEGVRVVSLGRSRTLACLGPLIRFLKKEQPDVLIANLGHNNILAIWAAAIARVKTKIIASQHSVLSTECATTSQWQYKVLPLLCRLFLPRAHRVVAVSEGVAEDLMKTAGLSRDKIAVVYNPLDFKNFRQRLSEPVPHPWFHDDGAPIILAVGRLSSQKDFKTLVKAFAKVRQKKDARLVIVGEGEEEGRLKELAASLGVAEYFSLAGFQKNPLPFMRNARMLVMSSIYEGFGIVLVEALACGMPVVSVNCPFGPAEVLGDGEFGRLVPVGDDAQMAEAILATLEDAAPPAGLEERGKAFTVERTIEGYISLFQ